MRGLPVALAALVMCVATLRAHDHWISRDRLIDPLSGEWCCSENDCDLIEAGGVMDVAGAYFIAGTAEMIPAARVIWKSGDGRWWRCRYLSGEKTGQTRCLIGPPPGS